MSTLRLILFLFALLFIGTTHTVEYSSSRTMKTTCKFSYSCSSKNDGSIIFEKCRINYALPTLSQTDFQQCTTQCCMKCNSDNLCFVDSLCVKEYQSYLSNDDCDKNNIQNENYFLVVSSIVTVIVVFFSLLGFCIIWIIFKCDCCIKKSDNKVSNITSTNQSMAKTKNINIEAVEKQNVSDVVSFQNI